MGHTTQLEEALALALKLPPGERLRLVEHVVASVEHEITRDMPSTQIPAEQWGQALNRLVDALDLSDWEALEINDPVEWVKRYADTMNRVWTPIGKSQDYTVSSRRQSEPDCP